MSDIVVSLVIPCLNEEKSLPAVLEKCKRVIDKMGLPGEIVLCDNGSIDKSREIALNFGARIISCAQKGYGHAVRTGMEHAVGTYLLFADADDTYDFLEADQFISRLQKGSELVMGSRLAGFIEQGAMPPLHRWVGTPILTWILNFFFKQHFTDSNCGMRGLTKEAFQRLNLSSGGMELCSEMIIKASLLHLKTEEIPIHYYRDKRERAPHLNTWRDGWKNLRLIMLYASNYTFILPGSILFIIGIVLEVATYFHVPLFSYTPSYHFIVLGCLLATLGFQTLMMGAIAKIYSFATEQIPETFFVKKWQLFFTLERGLFFGCALFLIGFSIDLIVLLTWIKSSFGVLNQLNNVIAASTLMIMGAQIIFSSFLISVLTMRITRNT